MKVKFSLIILLSIFSLCASAQEGCPGCVTALPVDMPEDTLFISTLPNGVAGNYYDADISFRMPKSTTPVAAVDSTVIGGLPINAITVKSIEGLPAGLSWEASQLEFETSEETDGCAKFCGTPLASGMFMIEVVLEATVIIVKQESRLFIPLFIAPPASMNEGFSMENNIGCGTAFVSFRNNIPSLGQTGYSYFWDFGNGKTSTDENPTQQFYNQPGEYVVNYQARIDTNDFVLTSVTVLEGDCTDLIGRPDYYISVIDPSGEEIYVAQHFDNEPLPLTFELEIPLDTGQYTLQVTDEDRGLEGTDDRCAEIPFTFSDSLLSRSGVVAVLGIEKPIDTIMTVDTVKVFELPASPKVTLAFNPPVCEGDTVTLTSNTYNSNLQWSKDNQIVVGETDQVLRATATGDYTISYTSDLGCTVVSAPVQVGFESRPVEPIFENTDNLLSLVNIADSTAAVRFQWFLDGEPLPMETQTMLCATQSGNYTLQIEDLNTGCTNTHSLALDYDETIFNCNLSSVEALAISEFNIYPNPFGEELFVEVGRTTHRQLQLSIRNVLGQVVHEATISSASTHRIALEQLESGIYFLTLQADQQILTKQLLKQ